MMHKWSEIKDKLAPERRARLDAEVQEHLKYVSKMSNTPFQTNKDPLGSMFNRKPEISLVRELGFDTESTVGEPTRETLFFIGPRLNSGTEYGDSASEYVIKEFIEYWKRQIETAELYLANNRNPNIHEWTVKKL